MARAQALSPTRSRRRERSDAVNGPTDAYKVLQVDHEAEDEVIVAAYRRLARKYHPDVASSPEAAAKMAAINAAWELIGDPAKRAVYDRERAARTAFATGAGSGSARPPGGPSSSPPRPGPASASAAGHRAPGTGPTSSTSRPSPAGDATGAAGGPSGSTAGGSSSAGSGGASRPPESVSRDWTSGRSSAGGGYDPSMRTADGTGAAGPPPGHASGSVLTFGRYAGWSLGEIARTDLEYLEWLDRMPIGRPYRDELDAILRRTGRRRSAPAEAADRRGLFRRR